MWPFIFWLFVRSNIIMFLWWALCRWSNKIRQERLNTTHVVNWRCTQDETCSHRQLDRHAVQPLGISVPNTLKKKTNTSAPVAAQSQDRDWHEKTKTRRSKTSTRRDSASRCLTTICWINEVNAVTVAADIHRANAAGGDGRKEQRGSTTTLYNCFCRKKKPLRCRWKATLR